MTRHGFTLIEIMVSLLIFTMVGIAMMVIMLTATEIYRSGEAGRLANDEAVAVMAALDDDLSRVVPSADGGWIYASLDVNDDGIADNDGNTLLAFKTVSRDRSQITRTGGGDRSIIAWWVDDKSLLCRGEAPAQIPDDDPATDQDLATLLSILDPNTQHSTVTSGCLFFGAFLSGEAVSRSLADEWVKDSNASDTFPNRTAYEFNTSVTTDPFPTAIRVTVALTGGSRFASKGFLVENLTGDNVRFAGVRGVPTAPGSVAKFIGPAGPPGTQRAVEWIGYERYSGGTLSWPSSDPRFGRGQRRSAPNQVFLAKSEVLFGQSYSLVRILR